jgi:hypothetical protein
MSFREQKKDGGGGERGGLWLTPWILFLIINTLMQKKSGHKVKNVPNSDIRFLYRLITLGIGGLKI